MKQKLKISSYEELNLEEVQEFQSNLWNPWTKHSLIRLLFTIPSGNKSPTNDVSTLFLSHDLCRTKRNSNKKFVLLVLLTISALIHRLSGRTIVEQKNFSLIKIRGRTRSERDYRSIYRNYFFNFNKKLNIFLHSFFSPGGEQKNCFFHLSFDSVKNYRIGIGNLNRQYYEFLTIIPDCAVPTESSFRIKTLLGNKDSDDPKILFRSCTVIRDGDWEHYFNSVFFDQLARKKYSLDKKKILSSQFLDGKLFSRDLAQQVKYGLIFRFALFQEFLDSLGKKDMKSFWWKKDIFCNLQSWGESEEIPVRSYVSLEKKYFIFNLIEFYFWQFFKELLYNLKKRQQLSKNKSTEKYFYFSGELDNPKLFIILESFLSEYLYRLSKYVIHIKNSNCRSINSPNNELSRNRNIDYTDLNFVNMYRESELLDLNEYDSEPEEEKKLYVKDASLVEMVRSNPANHCSFFKKGLDSGRKSLVSESSKNCSFLPQNKIKDFSESFYYVFSEPFLKDELFVDKDSSDSFKRIKNCDGSDYARMLNLWKIHKYYSIFLRNHSFLTNPTHITIQNNHFFLKKILYIFLENRLLPKIFHSFLSISFDLKELRIFINHIGLEKRLVRDKNGLDVPKYNEVINQNSNGTFRRISQQSGSDKDGGNSVDGTSNNKNKSINNVFFIESRKITYYFKSITNPIQIKFQKFYDLLQNGYNKLFSVSLIDLMKKELINSRNLYMQKGIINVYSTTWKKITQKSFIIHNASYIAHNKAIFEVYEWIIDNNWGENYSKIFVYYDRPIKRKLSINFAKTFCRMVFKSINQIWNSTRIFRNIYGIDLERNTLFDKSKKSFNCEIVFQNIFNHSQNSIYEFISYSKKASTRNYSSIHLRILSLFLKHPGSIPTINKIYYSFWKTASVVEPRLFNNFPSNTIYPERGIDGTETIYHYSEIQNLFREKKSILTLLQNNSKAETHYHILYSGTVVNRRNKNNRIFQSTNCIFIHPEPKHSQSKSLEYKVEKKKLGNISELCTTYHKYKGLEFSRYISFNNYTSWFFTSEWWEYYIYIFIEKCREFLPIISFYSKFFIKRNIRDSPRMESQNSKLEWNSHFSIDCEKASDFLWSNLELINNWSSLHWTFFIIVVCLSIFHQNHFQILIGSDYIDLWKNLERVKYLTDTSRAFRSTKLMRHNKARLNETENIVIHFLKDLPHYIRNIRFYLLTNRKLKRWLISNKSLDLSRRKRNLLIQSLITNMKLKGYGFRLYSKQKFLSNEFGYRVTHRQGLLYLQYLTKILKKKLVVNYSLHSADKWILFASLQKTILSRTLWQVKKFDPKLSEIPIPLEFGFYCSKSVLLIGPIETGRSYLIKNLAAEACAPLPKVSINKLLYNKPDVITENWMNILMESLRRLNLILDLAGKMSPCTIWIQDIHQLDVNRLTQNVESDPTFLLGILLKHFRTDSLRTQIKKNIIVIGSTHFPRKVDPALISPNRLDRIINIRLFDNSQRRNQFPVLLNKNNEFRLKKNLLHFNEFGSRTMGYNVRDLATLTNEVLLISITANESYIQTDTLRFAFHRQVFGSTHRNNEPKFQQNFEVALYKIGRAVAQNILVKDSAINILNTRNLLYKNQFYYLSKWYSESAVGESIIKESAILTHILGCLAGAAARDSWLLPKKYLNTSIPLDKSVENDFNLASSILESFSMEFPWLETCRTRFVNNQEKRIIILPTSGYLSIMKSGIFAIGDKNISYTDSSWYASISQQTHFNRKIESQNTAWSPRIWRLSFLRSQLFDWIKRFNDFEFSFSSESSRKSEHFFCSKSLKGRKGYNQIARGKKEQILYERILPRVRKRNIQELESQFEKILWEEQSEILGLFRSSTEYQIEYQLDNKLRLFIGKRILWDPIGSVIQMRHSIFSRRDFFVDEEMLRRLYVTYGARRERERSRSSHTIKQFFLCQGYNNDSISKLSVRWWNHINGQHSIGTLKRIEEMGIRLKRPRIFTPVYLYQRWLIENLPEKYPRFELLTHRKRWLKVNNPLLNDSFVHITLSESYQYLLKFFLSNRGLLNKMLKLLFTKGWLFQNEIIDLIRNTK
uniref:hypothetical chloroplast RF21 n=1 Tax=Pallavicinia lyellii TaxID=56939 RepID=UPI001D12CBC7|nr:hypothetical chloroplast RF21 [Pallavicinia lyellii]QZZ24652.1 hypothetical chloroplast RF21 [Pallavicinia lyellii]QZZ24736.1 hypothetical chloroplast RF21 [Pallavicinia lyellii]